MKIRTVHAAMNRDENQREGNGPVLSTWSDARVTARD